MSTYTPSPEILQKYADVLVKFALNSGEGIKPGEVVFISVPESAKPMLNPLQIAVLQAGGHPLLHLMPEGEDRWENSSRVFFENASDEQLAYLPQQYLLGRVADMDHFIAIDSSFDPHSLQGIEAKKLMTRQKASMFYREARDAKEHAGKLTWTLALFGTEGMAKEAGLTLEEYWTEIIQACYLDSEDPIQKWKEITETVNATKKSLTNLKIQSVHVEGEGIDLHVGLGSNRQWLGGGGRNIPSFEVFISPDWRGTQGHISFNQPLYYQSNVIRDISLTFENGIVTKATASKNESLLHEMIAVENANKIGEFSLTDKRLSRITKFMAHTLFDENVGGAYGNTHLALGLSYKDSYIGDPSTISKEEWDAMGFNSSVVHTDIMSTTDRTVTATLEDGSQKVIYTNGQFTV